MKLIRSEQDQAEQSRAEQRNKHDICVCIELESMEWNGMECNAIQSVPYRA
jgi:hypothetical protein